MSFKTKLFVTLWLAGMTGVVSFLLVDVNTLVASLPIPAGTEVPDFTLPLKLLSLIQPSAILAVAVLVGVTLTPNVGLSSPVAEALAGGGQPGSALKPQIVPGLVGGLAGGVAIVLAASLWRPFLPAEVVARIEGLGKMLPLPTRLLYGGITEELLLRWGFMTLLVWAAWRLFQKGQDKPKPAWFVVAILLSALVFAAGHLPLAFLLVPEPTFALTSYVIVANSIFGVIAGYLFWRKGLESAVIAHMLTHVVMYTAGYFRAFYSAGW